MHMVDYFIEYDTNVYALKAEKSVQKILIVIY